MTRAQANGGIQIETPSLVSAAFNPLLFAVDQFSDVGQNMSRAEARDLIRPFRHADKTPKKLAFKKMPFGRPDELVSALKNYVFLLDATVLLKPEILAALMLLVEDALELAERSPHEEGIFRSIAAYFYQEVEDVLRRVGASSGVLDVVQMIYDINYDDPSATHNSCIAAYHLHRYQTAARRITGNPNNPAALPANGAGGGGGANVEEKPLTVGQLLRAREKERKIRRDARRNQEKSKEDKTKDDSPPGGGRTDRCPWWNSSRGCDASKRRGNKPCEPWRHAFPVKEQDRLATLAAMSKFGLTAKSDFPASCPP